MNAGSAELSDDVERMLVDSAQSFFKSRHQTARMKLNAAKPLAFDATLWREMAEMGWLGLRLPEALNGQDLPLATAAALAEQFGVALAPEPYVACCLIPAALLGRLPESATRTEVADLLCAGRVVATLAWQERSGQLDSQCITTRLTPDGRLQGRKLFVPNADVCDLFIVSAQSDAGTALVTVRATAAGLRREYHRTGDGTSRGLLMFDGTPVAAMLAQGDAANTTLSHAIEEGTLASAAYQTGLANAVLDQLLSHLKTRIQFDHPLGAFQTLQHRAADLYMAGQLSCASWRRAAALWDAAPGSTQARAAISAAKARAGQTALITARAGIQMFGGLGFAEEADAGLAFRIALQYSSWLGGPAKHLQRFATLAGLSS